MCKGSYLHRQLSEPERLDAQCQFALNCDQLLQPACLLLPLVYRPTDIVPGSTDANAASKPVPSTHPFDTNRTHRNRRKKPASFDPP